MKCSRSEETNSLRMELETMLIMHSIDSARFPKPIGITNLKGRPCLIMERLGLSLSELNAKIELEVSEIVNIGLQMVDTIDIMHRMGFIHGDPHLGNWMTPLPTHLEEYMGPEHNPRHLKLIDYGFSQPIEVNEMIRQDILIILSNIRLLATDTIRQAFNLNRKFLYDRYSVRGTDPFLLSGELRIELQSLKSI
jgi:serine/threonine protein kinase